MRVRIEFIKTKSPYYFWILRLFQKFPTYKRSHEKDIEIHSIEMTERDFLSFDAIYSKIWTWKKTTAIYIDDQLIDGWTAWEKIRDSYKKLTGQKTISISPAGRSAITDRALLGLEIDLGKIDIPAGLKDIIRREQDRWYIDPKKLFDE